MKIYKCVFCDAMNGSCVSWHPNKRGADAELTALRLGRGEGAAGPEGVSLVDVPTDKRGLIEWLNTNLTTDNG
jgi:hypothetical protein